MTGVFDPSPKLSELLTLSELSDLDELYELCELISQQHIAQVEMVIFTFS